MYSYIVEEAPFVQYATFTRVMHLSEKVYRLFCLNIGIKGKMKSSFIQFL